VQQPVANFGNPETADPGPEDDDGPDDEDDLEPSTPQEAEEDGS